MFLPRLDGFSVAVDLKQRILDRIPTSLVRLGDGEAAILFPDEVPVNEIARCLTVWFGRTGISYMQLREMSDLLRGALKDTDYIGLPRHEQIEKNACYRILWDNLPNVVPQSVQTKFTDAAIHRYLQFGLLYRYLLEGLPFLGLISSRDLSRRLASTFNIEKIALYQIRGEAQSPGDILMPHYPDGFDKIMDTLTVPFKGAVFLVGAGWCGKIYCDLIKRKGGIAIDVGSLFDSWSNTATRLTHACHRLGPYKINRTISRAVAVDRYEKLTRHFKMAASQPTTETLNQLPDHW